MRAALVLVITAVVGATAAAAQDLTCTGSLQLASGRYIFTEPTRTLSLYSGLTISLGRLRMGGSIPAILQNSGAVTLVGGGSLPTGGAENGAVGGRRGGGRVPMGPGGGSAALVALAPGDRAGPGSDSVVEGPGGYAVSIGDPYLSVGVELFRGRGVLRSLEVTTSAKVPLTGLESGVGTGEWDYSAGVLAAGAAGPVLVFVDLTHWWYGDLPELELEDGLRLGGGLGMTLTRNVWVSAMAVLTNRIIHSAESARSVSVGFSHRIGEAGALSLTAGAGLTETSPDYTVSLGWRHGLGSSP